MKLSPNTLMGAAPVEIFPGLHVFHLQSPQDMLTGAIGKVVQESSLNVLSLPHAGFGYAVDEDSFIEEAISAYGLSRLAGINQLAFLEDPDVAPEASPFHSRFNHTRFAHSLDVMTLAALVVYNNPEFFADRPDYAKTVVVAALTHDVLTPAGGDTTKSIDWHAFDEDHWYPEVLKWPAVHTFLRDEGINPELLTETVAGNGILGSVLDIVDKLAYTSRDLLGFVGNTAHQQWSWGDNSPNRRALTSLSRQPFVTGLWSDISVCENGVVVTDTDRLEVFLRTRALLFQRLYTHPLARWHESLVAHTILSYLYDTRRLTREQLLQMTDSDLRAKINRLWETDAPQQLGFYHPGYQTFPTWAAAQAFEQSLLEQGVLFVQSEDVSSFFKPGTHFLISHNGKQQPLAVMYPKRADDIARLGKPLEPIRVYYLTKRAPELQASQEFAAWRLEKFAASIAV